MVKRRNAISGQWAARSIEMLESPPYRILSLSAHRALSRIEIEFAHHGGQDNGKLPVTFDDFAEYGIRRQSIGPALDELEALGFIKITEHGKMARAAEYRRPNKFLLMSRPPQKGVFTHDGWRRFKTMEDAEAAVDAAIAASRERRENLKAASTETALKASTETVLKSRKSQYRNGTTMRSTETVPLSISRRGPIGTDGEKLPTLAIPANDPSSQHLH
jgi:hypothetical protein